MALGTGKDHPQFILVAITTDYYNGYGGQRVTI